MTTLVLAERQHIHSAGGAFGVNQGEKLGLYELMATGAVTVYGLARAAQLPVTFVYRWLATQAREGYVHHDAAGGRFSLWCDVAGARPRLDGAEGGAS
jgi:hypothetical protein